MTVESTSRKQTFAGGQTALTFSFRTIVTHPEYIKVNKTLISTGVDTALVYGVDYTVALNANGIGGIVTLAPTFSTSYTTTVYRSTDDLQESDYNDFNQFPADTLEDDLDRRTLISQERSDDINRTPRLPISYTGNTLTLPNPLEGYSLVWSNGTLVNSNLTGATGVIGPTGATGPAGSISLVSSSTSDITMVSTGTTPIITAVNAATGGASKIVRLTTAGLLDMQVMPIQPTFAAYRSTSQSIPTGSTVKIQFDAEEIDNTNAYDNATNFRFTPTVPGNYLLVVSIGLANEVDQTEFTVYIYKNGSAVKLNNRRASGAESPASLQVTAIVSANGSDYFEGFVTQSSGAALNLSGVATQSYFCGHKIA